MIKLQTNNNLSDKTLLKVYGYYNLTNLTQIYDRSIAAATRVVHGRSAVQPNLKSALVERNHKLDSFFTVKTLAMKKKPKKGNDTTKSKSEIEGEARIKENSET